MEIADGRICYILEVGDAVSVSVSCAPSKLLTAWCLYRQTKHHELRNT